MGNMLEALKAAKLVDATKAKIEETRRREELEAAQRASALRQAVRATKE